MPYVLTGTTGTEGVTSAVSTITDIAGDCLSLITENPLLMIFFAAPLIGVAVGVIRKFKRA